MSLSKSSVSEATQAFVGLDAMGKAKNKSDLFAGLGEDKLVSLQLTLAEFLADNTPKQVALNEKFRTASPSLAGEEQTSEQDALTSELGHLNTQIKRAESDIKSVTEALRKQTQTGTVRPSVPATREKSPPKQGGRFSPRGILSFLGMGGSDSAIKYGPLSTEDSAEKENRQNRKSW